MYFDNIVPSIMKTIMILKQNTELTYTIKYAIDLLKYFDA